jgi:hypothetical protein
MKRETPTTDADGELRIGSSSCTDHQRFDKLDLTMDGIRLYRPRCAILKDSSTSTRRTGDQIGAPDRSPSAAPKQMASFSLVTPCLNNSIYLLMKTCSNNCEPRASGLAIVSSGRFRAFVVIVAKDESVKSVISIHHISGSNLVFKVDVSQLLMFLLRKRSRKESQLIEDAFQEDIGRLPKQPQG